jgi:prevent-host-death family protein
VTSRPTTRCISASYLRTHLHRLLRDVEAGATIVITRYGRPVALLMPISNATMDGS